MRHTNVFLGPNGFLGGGGPKAHADKVDVPFPPLMLMRLGPAPVKNNTVNNFPTETEPNLDYQCWREIW